MVAFGGARFPLPQSVCGGARARAAPSAQCARLLGPFGAGVALATEKATVVGQLCCSLGQK